VQIVFFSDCPLLHALSWGFVSPPYFSSASSRPGLSRVLAAFPSEGSPPFFDRIAKSNLWVYFRPRSFFFGPSLFPFEQDQLLFLQPTAPLSCRLDGANPFRPMDSSLSTSSAVKFARPSIIPLRRRSLPRVFPRLQECLSSCASIRLATHFSRRPDLQDPFLLRRDEVTL